MSSNESVSAGTATETATGGAGATPDPAVRVRVRELIQELAPRRADALADEMLLVEDLEYHSLALLELAFALEDEFDLPPLDEEKVQHIRTVADIEEHVAVQLASPGVAAS